MRSRIPARVQAAAAVAVLLILLLSGCKAAGSAASADAALADRLEKLPTLPADIAATLDPKTNATKIVGLPPEPVKLTVLPHAPCCSSKDQKTLKVKVTLTRCGPLHDLVLAPISDLVLARDTGGGGAPDGPAGALGSAGNVRVYKLNTINRASVWGSILCTTSDGPWDATYVEERHCVGYAPQFSLYVSAWGTLYPYYWTGGVENHPAEVSVVSCREIGTNSFACGISNCDCLSHTCPPEQPCPCAPPW